LRPDAFLTPDGSLILCSSHGALFEIATGLCVGGPCLGRSLRRVPVRIEAGLVMLEEGAEALAPSE
jgi:nitrite reductase/ring-hydroxylating ferredoxin subunit